MEDFVKMSSKNVYYITEKDREAYQIRPLIYDVKVKPVMEITQLVTLISFLDLLPIFCERIFVNWLLLERQFTWTCLRLIKLALVVQKVEVQVNITAKLQ